MNAAFEGVFAGIGRFVQSWFLPSLLAVGLASFFLFPAVRDKGVFQDIETLDSGERIALIALTALVLAVLLSSAAMPLYRVLEGYRLPARVAERKRSRHSARRDALRAQVPSVRDDPVRRGLTREQLDRYPRSSKAVMPTRLGNALKAGESYGRDQYGLDTVLLWNQLVSVAGGELKEALARTRSMMDFHAGVFWLSPLFAMASLGTALYASSPAHLTGIAAVLLCPLAYAGAVRAATLYAGVLRAVVDTSRLDLAAQLGLTLPLTLKEERELWAAVSDLFAWGDKWTNASEWIGAIDAARCIDSKTNDQPQAGRAGDQ